MTTLKINSGIPEGYFDGDDGVYEVALISISEPRTVTAQRGERAGQDVTLLDWQFAIGDDGPHAGQVIEASTSTASGPKSKMYSWLTALFEGKSPPVGTELDIEKHLIGRRALATIRRDTEGWYRIENLGALPSRAATPLPAPAAPARVAVAAGAPLREQVAGPVPGDLPF